MEDMLMNNYKKVRSIMSGDKISQILDCLPEIFSSDIFMFYFLLFFPSEEAKTIVYIEKGKINLLEWIDRYYLTSLARKKYLNCIKKKCSYKDKKWTRNLNHKEFKYVICK